MRPRAMVSKRVASAVLVLLLLLSAVCLPACTRKPLSELSVSVLKTGNSDCTVITDGTHTVLIDTADADDFDTISAELDSLGIKKIDAIILSHYDNDHVGSAADIILKYEVTAVYGPDYIRSSAATRAIDEAAVKRGTKVRMLSDDAEITVGEMKFTLYAPLLDEYEDENDHSLIALLGYGGTSFLFLGDSEQVRMSEFNSRVNGKSYDVVKLPHHGDYHRNIKDFVEYNRIGAAVSCVADSADMEPRLAELLAAANIDDIRTADGTVRFTTDGISVKSVYAE